MRMALLGKTTNKHVDLGDVPPQKTNCHLACNTLHMSAGAKWMVAEGLQVFCPRDELWSPHPVLPHPHSSRRGVLELF